MSCWEVALLVQKGRLALDRDPRVWVHDALALPGVRSIEVSPDVAVSAALMAPTFHGDPIDRLLVATAFDLRVPLVTSDDRLRGWPGLATIW